MSKQLLAKLVVSVLGATALVGVSHSAQACSIFGTPCKEVLREVAGGVPVTPLPSGGDYREPEPAEPESRERPESPGGENPENYRQREYEQSEPYPTDGSSEPVLVFTDEQPYTVSPERDNPVTVQPAPGRSPCDNACMGINSAGAFDRGEIGD